MVTCGVAYYKRHLSVYNFGVHNLSDDTASMFMWDESKAGRGASEIGSCLLKYIECQMTHHLLKTVTAFCDSCGGQNRNFKIATLLSFLVQTGLESITVNFMQSGHSFLPNDADFGVIEKATKAAGDVYVSEHWMRVVANARKHMPFTVVDMQPSDFIDLTAMSSQLTNRKKAEDGSIVSWLSIQCMQFTSDNPQVMKYKFLCNGEALWLLVDLRKRTRISLTARDKIQLVHATCKKRKLNRLKVTDLQSLKPFIPPVYHTVYDSLIPDTADDELL